MKPRQILGLILGVLAFLSTLFIDVPTLGFAGQVTLGIFLLAAVFWITEPVPIYTTSLLVIFLEVLLLSAEGPMVQYSSSSLEQVQSSLNTTNTAAVDDSSHWLADYRPPPYRNFFAALADPIIILFMGGCLLAEASVKYRLDRALTRLFLKPVGTNPSLIVLGLLIATAVLSAFMSNTATTAMMMTVVLPILAKLDSDDPGRRAVVLAVPVGANLGGIATPIGTPPNAIALAAAMKQGISISFATWALLAFPIVLLSLFIAWAVLVRWYRPRAREVPLDLAVDFDRSAKGLALCGVFGLTVVLWFTEKQHGISSNIVAFFPVVALPMLGIVGKKEIRNLPWDVLWLMAGGISLGTAIKATGLAEWLMGQIEWTALSGFAVCMGLAVFSFVLANFLSRTVTVTLLAPLAVSISTAIGEGTGFQLGVALVALAVASSFGMALPISTPPNAIAMGSGMVEARDLAKTGVVIGCLGVGLVFLLARFYWPLFLR